jgi:hypothetical protein
VFPQQLGALNVLIYRLSLNLNYYKHSAYN